jgi:hypothetical protein
VGLGKVADRHKPPEQASSSIEPDPVTLAGEFWIVKNAAFVQIYILKKIYILF